MAYAAPAEGGAGGEVDLHFKEPSPSLRGALATKQSILALRRDGLLRFARNDEKTHLLDLAAHYARALPVTSRPLQTEGAGNAGCALHPRSRVRWGRRWCTRAYRAAESIRHSLRNGFTAYNALSPVSLVLLPPQTPTSGRQDHASLPYASMPFVFGTSASTAPRPTFVTIMIRPSCRDGMTRDIPQFVFR